MSFAESVRHCLSHYAGFEGRASRSEYWWWTLYTIILLLVAGILDGILGLRFGDTTVLGVGYGVIYLVVALLLVLPSLAVTVRRLHDSGHTGWWVLGSLVCGIAFLIIGLLPGSAGPNKHGDAAAGAASP